MMLANTHEQEEQDHFLRIVGGKREAERLEALWHRATKGYKWTREQDFRQAAHNGGFSETAIKAFLNL